MKRNLTGSPALLLLAAALAVPAASQPPARSTPTLRPGPVNLCTDALGVTCRKPAKKAAPKKAARSAFDKFCNLAGMFMGRVDAAQTADFKFRITLDIKNPPSSTDNHIYWDDD